MAYNASEQLITAPVSIRNLQDCFGLGANDLGTIITTANINMWARFKPVKLATVGLITDAQRASVNHGITLPDITRGSITAANVMDAAANAATWGYDRPTGGASEPFRLADFANTISQGYYHGAQPFIEVNYPRNGWTFIKGGTSRSLMMLFDTDPGDQAINLHASDFTSLMDLREFKFVAYIQDIGLFESDDYILDADGEPTGTSISAVIPSTTGSYTKNVYLCMYRSVSGGSTKEIFPLPMGTDYDPGALKVNIKDDASAGGGGIPGDTTQEMFENIEFCPTLDGTYRTAWVSTDAGTGQWCMVSQGSLFVKMTLANTSGSTSTVQRAHFQLALDNLEPASAIRMYNSSKQQVQSVSILNNGQVTIYLEYDGIFNGLGSDWTNSNKNSSWSMDFQRNGSTLLGCDIYAMSGTDGWVER